MRTMRLAILAGAAGLVLAAACGSAPADDAAPAPAAAPDTAGGRYLFEKQADGLVRLDRQTGAVSLCSQRTVGWACTAMPDDRALFEDEMARLRNENAALKQELLTRGLPLPPGDASSVAPSAAPSPAPSAAPGSHIVVELPSQAEVDRMVAYAGRLWHRFVDAINRAQRQVLNKS